MDRLRLDEITLDGKTVEFRIYINRPRIVVYGDNEGIEEDDWHFESIVLVRVNTRDEALREAEQRVKQLQDSLRTEVKVVSYYK